MIEVAEIQKDEPVHEPEPLPKLDLACGTAKADGFTGVDIAKTDAVDVVHDLTKLPWPWDDNSIGEARCSHFFEHLTPKQRVNFMNELHRVLAPGAGCMFITPMGLDRMVQDFTHVWPPVVAASYYYFDREWLEVNGIGHYAELHGIQCDFEPKPVQVTVAPEHALRNEEHKAFAVRNYTNAPVDLIVLMVKKEKQ